jgi:hypothetical protein
VNAEINSEPINDIKVLGRFVEYSPMSMWSMWTENEHFDMISTFMLFKLLEPKEHIGRLVNVRIDCGRDKSLTSLTEKCIGNYFSFYLPSDYLESECIPIDDCSVSEIKRENFPHRPKKYRK